MSKMILVTIVAFCARRPWLVLGVSAVLTVFAAEYCATNFAINTDINRLISTNLPWRKLEIAYNQAFPDDDSTILAVIDAPTPEIASSASDRLTAALTKRTDAVKRVIQTSDSPFWRRNGLLFLPEPALKQTLGEITQSAGSLGPLTSDPTLRGVMNSIALSANAVQGKKATLNQIAPQYSAFAQSLEDVVSDRPATFSWQQFVGADSPSKQPDTRKLLQIVADLDYKALEPGQKATDAIRDAVSDLWLADEGVKVRLTGNVRISDDEFGTLKEGAALNGILTLLAVILVLWLALHSARIIFAVLVSLTVGLAATAALGLAMAGSFNPISIAFFVLFVGIGVDFGLQFSVGYRAERFETPKLIHALILAARNTGGRLALASFATAAGFLSFTPTSYKGLSELGMIAGVGMLVAFVTSITVLPALLRLLNPPAEQHPLGYAALAPVDRFLDRNRMYVLFITLGVVVAGLPLLAWLKFDLNPMNLRSSKVESVATLLDLRKDPEFGRTAEVIVPSARDAETTEKALQALPEVASTRTLAFFVPSDQDKKIAAIQSTARTVRPILNPAQTKPAPSPDEVLSSIQNAATAVRAISGSQFGNAESTAIARRLADALSALAKSDPDVRTKAEAVFINPFKITLAALKDSLDPQSVTLASLPSDIRRQWETADGRERVSVVPKGDVNDNGVLRRFVDAVVGVAPEAVGEAVLQQRAGETILDAFEKAAVVALLSIAILLWITLRRIVYVALTLFPLLLAGVVTLELCVIFNLPLNFANIIALPVLLGVGVAFKIYYIMAWREGGSGLLASPLTRAVFYSGMTTAVAFGSLWFSNHPGTSSMGELLALSLCTTMAAAVLFQPLLMGPPQKDKADKPVTNRQKSLETRPHTA